MTCIAATLKEMAGDSRITGDVLHNVDKLFRHGTSVFGLAGDWESCLEFVDFITKKGTTKPNMGDSVAFEAMELRETGIYLWGKTLRPYKLKGEFHAIGAGAQGAKVALHIGLSPEEAINAVAKVCEGVGGPVTVLSLKVKK
jgi:hypothetical protein